MNTPFLKTATRIGSGLRRGLAALAALGALALGGCGSDDPQPTPAPATGSVSGIVAQANTGAPMGGVAVRAGTRSATTAADGRYTLADVPPAERTVVSFDQPGFARQVLTLRVTAGATARGDARLSPVGATQAIDPTLAATVTVPGSPAQVRLPANGIVTASGGAPAGPVTVRVTPIDPAADPANMPGDYRAQGTGGTLRTIESFGALDVTLKDAAGNPLNLATGQTATIRIPVATRSPSVPATIPLYYFDEASGLWVQEGTATLAGTAPNRYYEGTVAHFTTWNADQDAQTVQVRGFLNECPPGASVDSYGVDYSGRASATPGPNCAFEVAIRKGSTATIFAQAGASSSNPLRVGPSEADIVLTTPLVLSTGGVPPQIVEQPRSQTAQLDSFALFSVAAVGSPVLRYQWQRNGSDLPGETTAYLVRQQVPADDDGARFTVVVRNEYGSVTSEAAVLTVNTTPLPPVILAQPAAASVRVGETATFEVIAAAQGGALSYQWRRNGADIRAADATRYTTPATVLADDGATYSVVVASSNGTSVTSAGARLTVTTIEPLAITAQPQPITVTAGQSAGFTVTVSGGAATPTYQWRRNGATIAGATAASYTTPPTTVQADNGAVFSVVVTSGAETLTSDEVALTVTPAPTGNGYYLLAQAGLVTSGTVTFANGVQNTVQQPLLAVNTATPGAGALTLEQEIPLSPVFGRSFEGTVSAGQVSGLRTRTLAYIKAGAFYKVDQVVANGGALTPQRWTTLTPQDLCGQDGQPKQAPVVSFGDPSNPLRTWWYLQAPGPDGQCGTVDDTYRALRLDMGPADAALTITGEPQVEIRGADGVFAGLVVRNGNKLQRLDANLANPVDLVTIDAAQYRNLGRVEGSNAPGIWLYIEAGNVFGVNLATPGQRVQLLSLGDGEDADPHIVSDGGTIFFGLSSTGFGSRVPTIGIGPGTGFSGGEVVATSTERLLGLNLTPTRLVLTLGGVGFSAALPSAVSSAPKTGGPLTPLLDAAEASIVTRVLTAGENVYIANSKFTAVANGGAIFVTGTLIVGADGTSAQPLANTDIKLGIAPASLPVVATSRSVYAVVLVDAVSDAAGTSNAGGSLRALVGATRAPLVTYGSLPAAPGNGVLLPASLDPLQFGQGGLLSFAAPGTTPGDLYFIKSDSAGLTRVTQVAGAASAGAVPVQAKRARPGATVSR